MKNHETKHAAEIRDEILAHHFGPVPSERATSEPQAQPRSLDVATCSVSRRPGDRGVWSIGDPLNPSRDDAMCGTEEAARLNAREMSGLDRIVAVWHGSDCIALYWEGQEWRRP